MASENSETGQAPKPHGRAADDEPSPTLESWIAVGLCVAVVLGSLAVVGTSRRIDETLEFLGEHRGPGIPAELTRPRRPAQRGYGAAPRLVCLVTIEGLRADRAGALESTLDLAESSVSFRTTCAQSSQELVSLKSLLTGQYPGSLILEETGADLDVLRAMKDPALFLRDTFVAVEPLLPSLLASAGYRTGGFTDGGYAASSRGFASSFETFEDRCVSFAGAVQRATAWLDSSDAPTFLFLHTTGLNEALSRAGTNGERDSYDEAVGQVDAAVGQLLDALVANGRMEDALVLLTGSRGTTLGERGGSRSGNLFLEQLLVPLVLRFPDSWPRPPRTETEAIELVDVTPSLLDACGIPLPSGLDGHSVLPILYRGVRGRRFLVAQTSWTEAGANPALRSVLCPDRWQLIHDGRDDAVEFFSLPADPAALVSTVPMPGEVPAFLRGLFEQRATDVAPGAGLPSSRASH